MNLPCNPLWKSWGINMNSVIYKYTLKHGEQLNIPIGWSPIRIGRVPGDDNLYMWAIHPTTPHDMKSEKNIATTLEVRRIELGIMEKQELQLPKKSTILHIEDIDGKFYLWYIYTPGIIEKTPRKIEMYKTGMPIEGDRIFLNYIGFCRLFIMQELGLYVFERVTK